jgi:hypothetical protein
MGGGGSESRGIGNLRSLIDQAKQELRKGDEGRRNVFISFAHEDLNVVNLLRGQAQNEKSAIEFNDWSVSDPFDSDRAPYIKQKIGERIARSSLTVVFLSSESAKSPWVEWEIQESLNRGKSVIGVFAGENRPTELPNGIVEHRLKCVPWSKLGETISALP